MQGKKTYVSIDEDKEDNYSETHNEPIELSETVFTLNVGGVQMDLDEYRTYEPSISRLLVELEEEGLYEPSLNRAQSTESQVSMGLPQASMSRGTVDGSGPSVGQTRSLSRGQQLPGRSEQPANVGTDLAASTLTAPSKGSNRQKHASFVVFAQEDFCSL